VGGLNASIKAYEQGYRFINVGHILAHGTLGLGADLRRLREYVAEREGKAGATASPAAVS
jgi:hypothetical protein